MQRVLHVVGARPNFMKVAPIVHAMAREPGQFDQLLVHTGQHYDANMSHVFFEELGLPRPDVNLGVGSGSHAQQTAVVMQKFEPILLEYQPDWLVVPGDVNSTLACALVAAKLGTKIAHVEAGLRSFDRTMPEEINRVLTDQISELLFTPSKDADQNLQREGIDEARICFVGNVMIDTLVRLLPKAEERWPNLLREFKLGDYLLVTLHRPSNVDDPTTLSQIMQALQQLGRDIQVVFPVHPRTRSKLAQIGFGATISGIRLLEPFGYLDFLALQAHAALVLTDSGGVQEETTYLGIPCLTARPNTERPVTISLGTNRLVKSHCSAIVKEAKAQLDGDRRLSSVNSAPPALWDGKAADRIVDALRKAD